MEQNSNVVWDQNPADNVTASICITAANAAELAALTAAQTTLNARSAAKTVTLVGNSLIIELTL